MDGRGLAAIAGLILWPAGLRAQPQTSAAAKEHADRAADYVQAGDLSHAEAELRTAVKLAPADASYLTSLGGILGMEQKLEEANIYFERAVKADPGNAIALRNLGANLWQLGRFKSSQAILERLLRIQPGDKVATLLLGMVAENQHEYARALKLLASVPELVGQRPEAVAALAGAYYHTGDRSQGRRLLEGLLGQPAPPQGVFAAAGVAADARDYEMAEKLFESIRPAFPDTTTIDYNLALIRFQTNRVAESEKMLLELVNGGHATGEVYGLLGRCYQKENNTAEAVRALDNAIRLEPGTESHYLDLTTILLDSKKLPAALEVARKTADTFPRSGAAWAMKGRTEVKMDLFTDAVRSYRRAVELAPKSVDAKVGLASAQWSAGMRADADMAFQTLLKEHPKDAAVYETYGTLLVSGDTDAVTELRATSLFNRALALDNSRVEPHYQLGMLALKKDTPESLARAREHFEAAERLGRNDSKIHYALARVYRRLELEAQATKEMQRYQQLKASEDSANLSQPIRQDR